MSDWTTHLEFEEGASSKFWRARVEGKTLYVNYGKIGSAGQTQVKDFADNTAATKEYDKLVREKTKKGYVAAGSGGGGGGGESGNDEDSDDGDDAEDDDDDAPPAKKPAVVAAAAAPPPKASSGQRLTLEAGSRKVVTHISLDGATVRMDAVETYASPEAAKKAHDRLKKSLLAEGYKE